MADDRAIHVDGLIELQRALKAIEAAAPKELAAGMKEAATIVATATASIVPKRSGKAARSIKPRGSSRGGSIAMGGNKAPYYPWLDFGGSTKVDDRRKGSKGRVARPFITGGRYLYPTIEDKAPEVRAKVDEVMADLIRKHGLETRGKA